MKYESYKNSDIEWLGKIPNLWRSVRFKDFTKVIQDGTHFTPTYTNDGINFLSVNDITRDVFDLSKSKFVSIEAHKELIKRCKPTKGDILLSKNGTIGIPFIIDFDTEVSIYVSLCLIRLNKEVLNKYFYFILLSEFMFEQYKINAKTNSVSNLHLDKLANFYSILPPLNEQNTIAQYLESKTQTIDKKVKLLTKKTDYFKELRKSIINDAVCKGLDKKVKLQVSEYIFSVNANWKRYRLKDLGFLYSGLSGKAGDDFNQDDNPNNKGFIPFTNIANNTYLKANHLGTVVVYENEKQNKVRKGDLFFLMSSEGYDDVGKTAALAENIPDTYLNSFCKGYRITKKNCEPYFLNYLLLSDNYRKSLITEGKGFTRINLKMEKVTDFFVYLPPTKEEQTAILTYLDEKNKKIDAIVSNIGKQIETLKELRKTLINDVVTGKIKVTNN